MLDWFRAKFLHSATPVLLADPIGKKSNVIPANAGIHFDFAFAVLRLAPSQIKNKIKMDPSVRWDDERLYFQ